jgi:hypothetical protein
VGDLSAAKRGAKLRKEHSDDPINRLPTPKGVGRWPPRSSIQAAIDLEDFTAGDADNTPANDPRDEWKQVIASPEWITIDEVKRQVSGGSFLKERPCRPGYEVNTATATSDDRKISTKQTARPREEIVTTSLLEGSDVEIRC